MAGRNPGRKRAAGAIQDSRFGAAGAQGSHRHWNAGQRRETEPLLLRDVEANLAALNELQAPGVRISMDGFGTCYSSQENLRSFPFD
jgi:hypothetical protein